MPTAILLSQGNEIVTGQLVDTNSATLAAHLFGLGFEVGGTASCGDRVEDIVETLRFATSRADLVISTGGLGPTDDDLTAEAVARLVEEPLALDDEALAGVEAAFRRFGVPMSPTNRKQAMLPRSARIVPNPQGTAPGFSVETRDCLCFFLPGVPREMKAMWEGTVRPAIVERWSLPRPLTAVFRVASAGESNLQHRLKELGDLGEGVELGFRTYMFENHVKLLLPAGALTDESPAVFERACSRVRASLGSDCYSEDEDESLAAVVGRMLTARGETVTTAESCTGGLLSSLLTSVSGSSDYFDRAFVTYANEAKAQMLGVDEALLAEHGAVSEPVVQAMAEGACERSGATWAMAITGIAGPTGGTPDKPVGTVFVAVAGPDRTRVRRLKLFRDRDLNRRLSASIALEMLRREMLRSGV